MLQVYEGIAIFSARLFLVNNQKLPNTKYNVHFKTDQYFEALHEAVKWNVSLNQSL